MNAKELFENAKELFEFAKTRNRMCGSIFNSCGDCKECELSEIGYCDPLSCNTVDEAQKLISAVEKWAKEHPVKTRQSELLKLFPKVDTDDYAVVAICPIDFGFKPKRDEYDACVGNCVNCRRKFWLAEIEEE